MSRALERVCVCVFSMKGGRVRCQVVSRPRLKEVGGEPMKDDLKDAMATWD